MLVLTLLPLGPLPARASDEISLPSPLDAERVLAERYWDWLRQEVGAPPDLPWPRIDVEPLPPTVRMAFAYPTAQTPWQTTRILISPRAIDRAAGPEHLVVFGELAHELAHYVLVMRENGWNHTGTELNDAVHHHCSPEFMRLTRKAGDFIWQVYHSPASVRSVERMVRLACWRDGHLVDRALVAR